MDPNRLENRYRTALVLAATGLILMALALFYLQQWEQTQGLDQLADRQLLLTSQTAGHIEQLLQRLQKGLGHLAEDGGALLESRQATAARLDFLADNYPPQLLTSLYLKDRQGNILAEYPPHRLASRFIPVHLLPSNPSIFSSPLLLFLADEPFLLLGEPIMKGQEQLGELAALIALDGLKTFFPASLRDRVDIDFLLDESGTFLLHRDPSLIGRSFTDVVPADRQPDLFHLLSAMVRGERGTGLYRDILLNPDAQADTLVKENLLTYAPLRVPGARWSLALALPDDVISARTRNDAGFRFTLSLGLLFVFLLTLPASRFLYRLRQLATERDHYREENSRLHSAAELAERRYRHLLDNAGDALFFIDPDSGTLREINRPAEDLLGYTAKEIRTLSLGVLFPGWQRRRYLRLVKRVLKDGYGEEGNLLFRRKDGQLFTGAVHARLGQLGETQVVHGVLRNVSEIKRIEQELRQKNRDLTLVNEIAHRAAGSRNLKDMLHAILTEVTQTFSVDGGGIFLIGGKNGSLELAVHRGVDAEILKDFSHITPGVGLVGRVAENGQPRTSADLQKDHRVRSQTVLTAGWRGFQAIPLVSNERTVGVLFMFSHNKRTLSREEMRLLLAIGKQVGTSVEGAQLFDALQWQHRLTEASNRELAFSRQQLKENLTRVEESNRVLERLDRMKSNFLALASHELRTPLTYILPSVEFLSESLKERLENDEKRFLEAIHQGGKRLQKVVHDLLEVARLESQSLYVGRERIDLPALVRAVRSDFHPILKSRELSLTIGEFPHPLPFFGDPDHLRKAVYRLVENAVKFTPRGGGIEIKASHRTPAEIEAMEPLLSPFSPSFFRKDITDPFLQMTVRDTGIGIDPEEQVRIFDKFYEVGDIGAHFTSQTRFGGKGVGLGLTLVRGMVEAHGGMVWVESPGTEKDGVGSAFHLLLPLAPDGGETVDAAD
jgi:hypothetical protein